LTCPEPTLEFDSADESVSDIELGRSPTPHAAASSLPFALLRRELRWFYRGMHGRVPAACEAPAREVAAASRIAGWLGELLPSHRGAFVLRYDGRRWPVGLLRQFGGLTSVVVRFAAMQRRRGPTETLAESEQAAVAELLADIAAVARPAGSSRCQDNQSDQAKRLRRLRHAAHKYVLRAERAYFDARSGAPCAVPASQEGA